MLTPHLNFNLFLDDVRQPRNVTWTDLPENANWIVVRSYDEFVRTISHEARKGYIPSFVSFDHDLDDEHYQAYQTLPHLGYDRAYGKCLVPTGLKALEWFIEQILRPSLAPFPPYALHTMNETGLIVMRQSINNYIQWLSTQSSTSTSESQAS
jgi:hypothetical protein